MATTTQTTSEMQISKGGYIAFDALSLRQLILNRLNEQQIFTDQNFIGSNLAAIIDIISYSYNTLMYYLNRTSNESMFTEAQLYENINRIVKLIDYNPIGFQTSTLNFQGTVSNLERGLYTIPRYTYVLANNIPFSFNEDITFVKTESITTELLTELSEQKLLYQGSYQEYPLYVAAGDNNETVILNTSDEFIDHFNIDVYVKPLQTGVWEEYSETVNLYLETGSEKKYEIRLNGNKRYEIKFGNDINGRKLQQGDTVAIYYLKSSGADGEVGAGAIDPESSPLVRLNTLQFNQILQDILQNRLQLLTNEELQNITLTNTDNSTPIKNIETPDEIRQGAPLNYRSQNRLVTSSDYETFVRTNFANLITDVRVFNNTDYVNSYLKYYYEIGLTEPLKTDRALYNQVLFSDACNFNNIYVVVVPRTGNLQTFNYLLPAQKQLIRSSITDNKITTTETVFVDPVYKSISFGIAGPEATINPNLLDSTDVLQFLDFNPNIEESLCELQVVKKLTSRRDNFSIINDIANIFSNYFDRKNITLGQTIDTRLLNQQILSINGVDSFFTARIDDPRIRIEGLSFFVWNPSYINNDKTITTSNILFRNFEYPYFSNLRDIASKIKILTTNTIFETIQ